MNVRGGSSTANLRLELQVEALCAVVRPAVVVTMYEGHAWERCVFRGARRALPKIKCVAYQHTILRQTTHALRRSLGKALDPDVVMCMGEITRDELDAGRTLPHTRFIVAGTHRRQEDTSVPDAPVTRDVCLVLPEGISEEARFLFSFALETARMRPQTTFIFRSHPLLPVEQGIAELLGDQPLPANVEASVGRPFEADLDRAGSILYRGSSTVLYGILRGLKAYYVNRIGELNLDPLYNLEHWRQNLTRPDQLADAMEADLTGPADERRREWEVAVSYSQRYTMAEQPSAIDELARLAGARR